MPASIRAFILCLLAFAFPMARAYAAPSIQFNPTAITVAGGNTFQVNVAINVDSNQVKGSDVVVQYNAADLSAVSFTNGGFFPSLAGSTGASGRVEMHGYTSQTDSKSGSGTFATITFKALKDTGSSALSYVCADTDILTASLANILTCPQNVNTAAVTFGTGSPTPEQNNNPQNTIPTCTGLTANPASGSGPRLAVTLTCSGIDPDGYINGATFVFGDGSNDTVSKNVGSPGSLSIAHTYTTIGTVGATCMVRDNNQAYSPSTDSCRALVTLTSPASSYTYVPPATTDAIPTPEITIPMITEAPLYIPTPEITPSPTVAVQEKPSSPPWWLIGAVLLIIVGSVVLILSKRNRPPGAPPMTQEPQPPFDSVPPTNEPPPPQA